MGSVERGSFPVYYIAGKIKNLKCIRTIIFCKYIEVGKIVRR